MRVPPGSSFLLVTMFPVAVAHCQAQVLTLTSTRDNTLYAITNGSLSNGAGNAMFSGVTLGGEVRRAVVAFDLASAIPVGSIVTAASLQVFVTMTASPPGNVSLHRLLVDWGEGTSVATGGGGGGGAGGPAATGDATWLHRFYPGTFWTSAGGDFAPTASATVLVPDMGFQVWASNPVLVANVQGWVDNPASNFGWLILTPETLNDRTRRIATREHLIASERPLLTVTFTPPTPATFAVFGSGCAGSAGIPALAPQPGSLPVLGGLFHLALSGLPSATPVAIGVLGFSTTANLTVLGSYALPFEMTAFGMPGCHQRVSADGLFTLPAGSGQALWSLSMPGLPTFTGLAFHVQGLVPDAGVNPLGAIMSNAGTGVLGF